MNSLEINNSDEPLTPAGRLFLRPELNQIIHCIIGVENPINIDAIKSEISSSIMIKHPRFSSLMVRDSDGIELWRKTQINIDQHCCIVDYPSAADSESAVNEYLSDLAVSSPLSFDKPLWEVHLLVKQRCAVLRIHHALGDGISLMSLFLACCRRADDGDKLPTMVSQSRRKGNGRRSGMDLVMEFVKMVWFSLVFVIEFVLRVLWVCDRKTAIIGGDGVELWPRKLATARFGLDDIKLVKSAVVNATVNDVIFGVLSSGLSRYLDHRAKGMKTGLRLTGLAMVNLREQSGLQDIAKLMKSNSGLQWGNRFGIFLLPVYYHKDDLDPLQYLKRAKVMIDRKKKSLEAHFSYHLGDLIMSCFGPKFACALNYRMMCQTSFTFSNVVGPQEEITFAGHRITYLRVTSTSLPHALTMHMVSYAGTADMQILVAKDIIPDPEFLAKCFEDALLEMKEAALTAAATKL